MPSTNLETGVKPSPLKQLLLRVGGGKAPVALADQALVSGSNFVTNILLARTFGFRDYGVFALAWVAVMFANSLQWAFVVTPMMSIGPKQAKEDLPTYYGAVLVQEIVFALLIALLVFGGVVLSGRFFPQWNIGSLRLSLAGATLAYLLQDFIRRFFFTTNRSGLAFTSDCISYLTQLPILFYISRHPGVSLPQVLWIIAATSFLGFIVCMKWYQPLAFSRESLVSVSVRHWKMSRWLAPSAFMQWGAGNLFFMAAPAYYGAATSAALKASQNIVAVAHIWFMGLDNVVPTEASAAMHRGGPTAVLQYLKQVFIRWGGLTLVFVAVVALFPHFWLKLAYGPKYLAYGYVLQLYAVLYLMVFVSSPIRAGLQALEFTAPIFWAYPVLIAFSVTMVGPLAKRLGLLGVMIGMIAIQVIFQGIIGAAFLWRARRMQRQYEHPVAALPEA